MQKKQILINATISVTQIIVIGLTLFILYRFLLDNIGVEQLGLWSLLLATVSVTKIANFGLSGSVVKFVAKYVAREEYEHVSNVIQTSVITVGVTVGVVLIIGYPLAKWIIGLVISDHFILLAYAILPYTFLALWIMAVTSIVQSGFDGYQRIDIRSYLLIGGAIIHLLLCFYFVPKHGLIGLAYSGIIQNIIVLVVSWLLLKKRNQYLPFFPINWNKRTFKEIIVYGINFQVISISSMFYEPVTKLLLSIFGGLSMLGYYEMASKMVQHFRSLIVSANQVLVPAIADLNERMSEKIHSLYIISYQLLFYLSLPMYSLIIISSPAISKIWIGNYEYNFIIFVILLSIGWFLNTLNAPAFFSFMGVGYLRWNVISQISVGLLNVGLGLLMGILYNGIGVIVAWVISLALGSSIVYFSYHIKHHIPLKYLLPRDNIPIIIVCLVGLLSMLIIHNNFNNYFSNNFIFDGIIILFFSITILIFIWLHPMRKRMMSWIGVYIFNMETSK
jgi:O-antigen/teichoic acid export membrane protein